MFCATVMCGYPGMDVARRGGSGKVGLAISGNHAIRACVAAMRATFATVRREAGIAGVEASIASVDDVFALQDVRGISDIEKRFLR